MITFEKSFSRFFASLNPNMASDLRHLVKFSRYSKFSEIRTSEIRIYSKKHFKTSKISYARVKYVTPTFLMVPAKRKCDYTEKKPDQETNHVQVHGRKN